MERLARLALASELIGVANKMVELASAHVTDRFQFGRPIGSNQAVRFRVADAYAEVAGAQSLISAAWRDGSEQAALTAKTVAGRAHSTVVNNVLQVGGAIGLSEEHPFPHLARRGFALDALLGSFLKDEGTLAGDTAGIRLAEPIGAF
jgi:alkylation response protein AidB-like acyl-CoA dehydrogenase